MSGRYEAWYQTLIDLQAAALADGVDPHDMIFSYTVFIDALNRFIRDQEASGHDQPST